MIRRSEAVLQTGAAKAQARMNSDRRCRTFLWASWIAVFVVTALRAAFAARLPLTGDEAYYWEWSRRLAAGYTDHPPAIAFAIAAFTWMGTSPFAVRVPFILCGIGAALACAGAAATLARDARAGAIAALGVTLAPIVSVAFSTATPDGPYAFFWALSLYFAARAYTRGGAQWFVLLGIALGGALLSRLFALALFAGVLAAGRHARATFIAAAIALVLWSPFLWWNGTHHWISFAFALVQRHETQVQLLRPLLLYATAALAFSPGFWIAATIASARQKYALIAWTALPLSGLLLLLSLRERVEVYWFIGPYISLCVAIGCAYVSWEEKRRQSGLKWMAVPAAALSALVFIAALAPGAVYSILRGSGVKLSDGGPFEMFTYQRLAHDVAREVNARGGIAMTDGYGFSSLLDFYGDLQPVVIGYAAQGEEAHGWFTGGKDPQPALFVDKVPLQTRPDFVHQLSIACARVTPGPTFSYAFSAADKNVPPRRYYTTWCEGLSARSVAMLRWERPAYGRMR